MEFRTLVTTGQNVSASKLYGIVTDVAVTSLFAVGPVVCHLIDVVLDMIYQLEGDTPLLSQILPMIKMLEQHVVF
jgi:hypothetical protein